MKYMYRFLDTITIGGMLCLLLLAGPNLPNAFGGSISFFILIPLLYVVSYSARKFKWEISLLNLSIICIAGINYINFLDISGIYTKMNLAILFGVLLLTVFLCFISVFLMPLNFYSPPDQNEKVSLIRSNLKFIVLQYPLVAFCYVVFMCLVFVGGEDFYSVRNNVVKMIPTAFFWAPVFFIVINITLKKVKEGHINHIVKENNIDIFDMPNIKAIYFVFAIVIFILGSLMELVRKDWLFWLENFVFLNAMIICLWKVYKHRIKSQEVEKAKMNDMDEITSLVTFKRILTIWTVNTLILSSNVVGFTFLLALYKGN